MKSEKEIEIKRDSYLEQVKKEKNDIVKKTLLLLVSELDWVLGESVL